MGHYASLAADCPMPTDIAGHASAVAVSQLTFHMNHSVGG
jgi:hypothetical protein